jgi:hypothetical protein
MRIASLTVIALFAVVSAAPVAAQEQATFIKRPKVLGIKDSTVTTYRSIGDASGSSINCSGRCFSDGGMRYWR